MFSSKRHRVVGYEKNDSEQHFQKLDSQLRRYRDAEGDSDSDSDSDSVELEDYSDGDSVNDDDEVEADVGLKPPDVFTADERKSGKKIGDGVMYFPSGCIGIRHLVKYRMRPPVADALYSEEADFEFQMNDIEYSINKRDGKPFLRMYGITKEGYSVVANINGYRPHFSIRWPKQAVDTGLLEKFISALDFEIRKQSYRDHNIKHHDLLTVSYEIKQGIDTRGYTDSLYTFVTLYMAYPALVGRARRIIEGRNWAYSDLVCDTYESDINFELRYLCDTDITGEMMLRVPAGCFSMRRLLALKSCVVDFEIDIGDYQKLKIAEDQINVSKKVIFSWDAEMLCDRGVFPEPEHDSIIMIGVVLRILGEQERKKLCFCLGPSLSIQDRYPGAEVLCYEREIDMMRGFRWLMLISDPDILTGYNIINFDLPYLINRANALGAPDVAFLGRLAGKASKVRDDTKGDRAHGFRQNKKINVDGRTQFDILPILMKEAKLRSYTLNAVSAEYLGEQKEDVSYDKIPEYFRNDPTRLVTYCIKDAYLPDRLLEKLRLLLTYIEKARITGITMRLLLERGLGFQGKSGVYRRFRAQNPRVYIYVRTEEQRQRDSETSGYIGAHVEPPVRAYYEEPMITLDFSALYPSIIMANNICNTTITTVGYVKDRGWKRASLHNKENDDGDYFQIPSFTFDREKKTFNRVYSDNDTCFVTKKHRVGIMPQLLEDVLKKRKAVKGEMFVAGEETERLQEYAKDVDADTAEIEKLIDFYTEQVAEREQILQNENRADELKLKREVKRMLWKIDRLKQALPMTRKQRSQESAAAYAASIDEAFNEGLFDTRQLQLKLIANAMYGLYGASTSFLYYMAVAAAVTAVGRYMIVRTRFDAELQFCKANGYPTDSKVVYGDSVTSDTPILTKLTNDDAHVALYQACELPTDEGGWRQAPNEKEYALPASGLMVWSNKGWTKIKTLIRHKVCKPIKLVTTNSGCVAVTVDHSLIKKDGSVVTPTNLSPDDQLLTCPCPTAALEDYIIPEETLWIWGLFFMYGSCSYKLGWRSGSLTTVNACWSIAAPSAEIAQRALDILNQNQKKFSVTESNVIYLDIPDHQPINSGLFCGLWSSDHLFKERQRAFLCVKNWSATFYSPHGKRVPNIVLNCSKNQIFKFLEGAQLYKNSVLCREIKLNEQLSAAGLYILLRMIGTHTQIAVELNERGCDYTLKNDPGCSGSSSCEKCYNSFVTGMYNVENGEGYVYDLETEDHTFGAGVGAISVHNTDSIFVYTPGLTLEEARVLGMEMSAYCSKRWPPPHKLEAEKILYPAILMKKKKYAVMKYEMDPESGSLKAPKADAGGFVTRRRDNCRLSTRILDQTLKLLLTLDGGKGSGLRRSQEYIKTEVAKLRRGDVNWFDLIVSKQLRKLNYATPTIHSVLAKKMGLGSGSRVQYVVKKAHKGAKLYECGEDPETAFRKGIPIDYDYYLFKQLMEPTIRLFSPILAPKLDIDKSSDRLAIRRAVYRALFIGDHMRIQKLEVSQEFIRRGVFTVVPQCCECKCILKTGEQQFCKRCRETHGYKLLQNLQQKMEDLCTERLEQWKTCQTCLGTEVATTIICDQRDCRNYWERRKTAKDAEVIAERLKALMW